MAGHRQQRHVAVSVGLVVVGILVAAVVANVVAPVFFEAVGTPPSLVPAAVAAAMMLGFGGVAAVAIDRTGVDVPFHRPTTTDGRWIIATLGGLALVFLVFAFGLPALGIDTPLSRADLAREAAPSSFVAVAVVAILFVGPFEELVFRGFMQGALEAVTDERVGLVVAAAVFGLFHALAAVDGQAIYVSYAFLQGLVLGYAYTRTGNLLVVALAHGLFDAGINLVEWLQVAGLG